MPRKMNSPERADYFRIFPAIMLLDDDYVDLDRAQWGSVFLLMMNQWAKRGTLPADPRKLARIAECSLPELEELQRVWPKLQPVDGEPDRVGIPYLVKEWREVMGFYQEQKEKSQLGIEARKIKAEAILAQLDTHGEPMDHPDDILGEPTVNPLREREALALALALDQERLRETEDTQSTPRVESAKPIPPPTPPSSNSSNKKIKEVYEAWIALVGKHPSLKHPKNPEVAINALGLALQEDRLGKIKFLAAMDLVDQTPDLRDPNGWCVNLMNLINKPEYLNELAAKRLAQGNFLVKLKSGFHWFCFKGTFPSKTKPAEPSGWRVYPAFATEEEARSAKLQVTEWMGAYDE